MRLVRGPRHHWPLGLLGMLALVVAIEAIEARQGDDLSHPWAIDWKHGDRAVSRDARSCQILCFGDSLVKYGVVPRVLGHRLGKTTYNLALGAAPPPISYYMFQHAIEAGARPDAVLVDFIPHLLSCGPEIASVLLPEVLRLADCAELGWEARDLNLLASVALPRILPTVKDRLEIRSALLGAFRGEDRGPRRWVNAAGRRNWHVNRGSYVAVRQVRSGGDDLPFAKDLYPPEWNCTVLNACYVRKFLRLAASHSIPVFWLIPPFSSEVHLRRSGAGLDARYDQFVARMLAKFPTLTVVDGRKSGYDASVHCDPLHLDRRGASVFTEEVAEVVARHLAGSANLPRWVDLPPYRDRPADLALEDAMQSHLAVKDDVTTARR